MALRTGTLALAALALFMSPTHTRAHTDAQEAAIDPAESKALARGWGSDIAWVPWSKAQSIAESTGKPIMLVIHKSWCGACKNLKPVFAASTDIANASAEFVMVNAQDDEEPDSETFRPDGGYIPRILFLEPSGEVMKDVFNTHGSPKYKYYYHEPATIVSSMKLASARGRRHADPPVHAAVEAEL